MEEKEPWIVKEGLKPEDRVIVGSLEGLKEGMVVRPKEEDAAPPKPANPPDKEAKAPLVPRQTGMSAPPGASTGAAAVVEAVYPGANAQVVSDTVRAPIEEQLSGMEGLRYLRSRCTNDGRYTLALTFAGKVDRPITQVLVQNRVALATPVLPAAVQNAGVTVKKGTAGVLLIVSLFSPDGKFDPLFLSNYATIYIKDELSRVAGVGDVSLYGQVDAGLRIWLDPQKLAACGLNAGDVTRALEKQKEKVKDDPEHFGMLALKKSGRGVVLLRDVAQIEFGASHRNRLVLLDGKPIVALSVQPTGEISPQKLRAALGERLDELRKRLPDGVDLDVTFDFTNHLATPSEPATPEYLLLDLDLPAAASAERTEEILKRCEALTRRQPGVKHVLALSENPFDLFGGRPSLLVQLSTAEQRKTAREDVIRTLRTSLGEIKDVAVRVRDLSLPRSFPRCGYPITLALHGPDPAEVRIWAGKLGELMTRSQKLTDVWASTDSAPQPQLYVDIDREKAAALGVTLQDINSTLQVYLGGLNVGDFNRFGRTWRMTVQAGPGGMDQAKDIGKLQVRNNNGQMVSLGTLVTVRQIKAPAVLDFLDLQPMVEITANLAPGTSSQQARLLCEGLAAGLRKELRLPAQYRLTWLGEK